MSVTRRQKGRVIGFGLVLHRAREENWETNKTSPASGGIYFSKLSRVESRPVGRKELWARLGVSIEIDALDQHAAITCQVRATVGH